MTDVNEVSTKANEAIRAYERALDDLVEAARKEKQAEHRVTAAMAEEKAARGDHERAQWALKAARGEVTQREFAKSAAVCARDHLEPCIGCKLIAAGNSPQGVTHTCGRARQALDEGLDEQA